MSIAFQRARKPEEIETRRRALLAAAAELFDAEGPLGAGLNAIAARAGFTKSNVYRYFESREQVLLALFLAEMDEMVPALCADLAAAPEDDVQALAQALAASFAAASRKLANGRRARRPWKPLPRARRVRGLGTLHA